MRVDSELFNHSFKLMAMECTSRVSQIKIDISVVVTSQNVEQSHVNVHHLVEPPEGIFFLLIVSKIEQQGASASYFCLRSHQNLL